MARSELEILIKIRDEATNGIKQLQSQVSEVGKEFLNTKSAIEMAASALATYSGFKMLGSFIAETRSANLAMAQAQFYANALGTATAKNLMPQIIETGKAMRDLYGISDELASKAYAKMIAKFGEGNKTLDGLNTLIKLHKLGFWDLDSSTTMLMGSTDDMTRALQFMARALGVEVNPEMDDLWEILDKIKKREENIDFSKLGAQMDIFKEKIGDVKEIAGTPFMEVLNMILGWVNIALDKFPLLGDVIAGVFTVIALGLAGLGIGIAVATILSAFGVTLAAAGPWGLAIGAILAAIVFAIYEVIKNWDNIKNFFIITWNAITEFLQNTWNKIKQTATAIWDGIKIMFATAINFIIKLFQNMPYYIGYAIGYLLGVIVNGFKAIYDFITVTVPNIIGFIVQWFAGMPEKIWNAIILFKDTLSRWASEILSQVANVMPGVINAIVDWFKQLPNRIWETISGIPGKVADALESVKDWFGGAWEGAKTGFEAVTGMKSKALGGYVPETEPYLLHGGEYVVPRSGALIAVGARTGGQTFNIYLSGNTFMSDEDTAVRIGDMIIKALQRNIRF